MLIGHHLCKVYENKTGKMLFFSFCILEIAKLNPREIFARKNREIKYKRNKVRRRYCKSHI